MSFDSSSTSCPICYLTLPFSEIQRHANSHFDDADDYSLSCSYYDDNDNDQFSKDLHLAQQIASSSSPPPTAHNYELECFTGFHHAPHSTVTTSSFSSASGVADSHLNEEISCLISLQSRSSFYHVKDGVIPLLRNCLELEARYDHNLSISILSGHVDHFQSIVSEDVGWGCGWRNIQMLCSHLLSKRREAKEVLFGGSGFVPDIPSLQRWLEIAWERGFDLPGSYHFNQTIYGSAKKIGTTECAALLRSFGLRARIVDFGPKELNSLYLSVPGANLEVQGKRKSVQVCGPMDKYVSKKDYPTHQPDSNWHVKVRNTGNQLGDTLTGITTDNLAKNVTSQSKGNQILVDWVWNYFSDESLTISGDRCVVVSDKAPLYFQHDGHSRTIVGIQAKHQRNGVQQYSLLVLDPGHRTAALESSLKEKAGWQKLIKRGVHTLKKPQYQLCYIDPGIATMEEMEQLKIMDSTFIEV